MGMFREYRQLIFGWILWALVMLFLVQLVGMRFQLLAPDRALGWTAAETMPGQQGQFPNLQTKLLNGHIAWDSEYYLSIAQAGYRDPQARAIPSYFNWADPTVALQSEHPDWTTLNHAFFPGYPYAMALVAAPLRLAGLDPLSAASLAGVLVSMLGTLFAMVGLFRLGLGLFDKETAGRAAFYLLIMPASMFLCMVYTEGFFLGLSFMALSYARVQKFLPAAIFAFLATLTKAAGALLILPLVLYWYGNDGGVRIIYGTTRRDWGRFFLALSPLYAYIIFALTLGDAFHLVEKRYFGRELLALGTTIGRWGEAIISMGTEPHAFAYYMVELLALAAGVFSLVRMFKLDRILAIYGLVSLVFSLTSGVAQGMHRYVMALPSLFLIPAALGKNRIFDRSWIFLNLPLMFLLLTSFVHNQWAG